MVYDCTPKTQYGRTAPRELPSAHNSSWRMTTLESIRRSEVTTAAQVSSADVSTARTEMTSFPKVCFGLHDGTDLGLSELCMLRCTTACFSPNIRGSVVIANERVADKWATSARPQVLSHILSFRMRKPDQCLRSRSSLLSPRFSPSCSLSSTLLIFDHALLRCLIYDRGAGSPDPGIAHHGRWAPPSPNLLPRRRSFHTHRRTTTILQPRRRHSEVGSRFPTDSNERCQPFRCRPERWTRRR